MDVVPIIMHTKFEGLGKIAMKGHKEGAGGSPPWPHYYTEKTLVLIKHNFMW